MPRPQTSFNLHSATIRATNKGHPWITYDSFSKLFPQKSLLLIGIDNQDKPICTFINDPFNKNIKGRIWSTRPPFSLNIKDFKKDLKSRIFEAISLREKQKIFSERSNFYLVFGEGDFLPGLFVQLLGNVILIQYYVSFWKNHLDYIVHVLIDHLSSDLLGFPNKKNISFWFQDRTKKESKPTPLSKKDGKNNKFTINEYGIDYLIKFQDNYDFGIFTDMSSIRKKIFQQIPTPSKVLNLFSYTGAFSLHALKNNAKHVVSIDSSNKTNEWLEENIFINSNLASSNHSIIEKTAEKAIVDLKKDNESFDLIICDPPTMSTNGKSTSNSIAFYQNNLNKMLEILDKNGSLIIFINTHKISNKQFEDKIKTIKTNHKITMSDKYFLTEDCPTRQSFPEGSYIKGIRIIKS